MADAFVGPIIEKLIDIGFEYLKDQVRWQTGMKEELERLRNNLPQIQAVVDYASTLEHIKDKNQALNAWLWHLRDAIDEADDVMEELEYPKLIKQLSRTETEKPRKVRSIMRSIKKKLVQICRRALKNDPTLKRLEEVVHKLDQVSAGSATFLHLVDKADQKHKEQQLELNSARETGCEPKNVPIGRDNEKEFVMNWLKKTSNENQATPYSNISLLSIVGQGGIGKTTLLQQVFNESDEKEFDLKMWACVSNDFNKNKVIKDILESATATGERSSSETLVALQRTLKSKVNSNKFLLVLDDIWEEEENKEMNKSKWEDVLAPLASGKLGSKILVTTRMGSISVMLSEIIHKKMESLTLEGLNDGECLQLLYNHAFNKGEDPTAYPTLRPIAEKIVKKLSGSPLAAKVIGGVLSSHLDETHWKRVLNYEIGSQKGILDILKLSYISLPKVLQSCFSFCCTFPQDYGFDKDDLVRMWIALGFIQPDNTRGETMKDAGERYFDNLVQKSLFDKIQRGYKTCYKLHDLLHEMLQTFSAQECCSIVGGGGEELLSKAPKTIRHLFLKNVELVVLKKVEKFKYLRSFILIDPKVGEDLDDIIAKIFKILRSIRLIYIVAILEKTPKEIEDLIHLQYLEINCSFKLPAEVPLPAFWRLHFLKYLFLSYVPEVRGFDYKFNGNEKVRVFPSLQVLHIELMSLKALENLFVATEAAYKCLFPCLTELHLKNCPNLKEFPAGLPPKLEIDRVFPSLQVLHIERLGALENSFFATEAAYECLFSCLTELHLKHCSNLLELPAGLPPKLEKLEIDNTGLKGSNWLQGISTNYCSISIKKCRNLIYLKGHQEMDQTTKKCQLILSELIINDPSLLLKVPLTNVTSIQKLKIIDNDEVISLDDVEEWFLKVSSSLCELKFISFTSLQFLPSFLESLSSLKILVVSYIPLLQLLPNMPASLKIVEIHHLKSLMSLPSSLSFSSLEHLYLDSIPLLKELPELPPSLCKLELYNLYNLHCLPSLVTRCFSLKELLLLNLPQLPKLPNLLPTSLYKLQLHTLSNLHCLPSCLPHLFSLKKLKLANLPQLRELPGLPPSLEALEIWGCNPELEKRYQKDTGSDWYKIARIPTVRMGEFGTTLHCNN